MFAYPKLKYRPVISPEQHGHWQHVIVHDPVAEELLGDGWYDHPREFPQAEEAPAPAAEVAPAAAPAPEEKPKRSHRKKTAPEPDAQPEDQVN